MLRRAGTVLAVAGMFVFVPTAQAAVDKLATDGQRPSVAVSPADDSAYVTWANPGAGGDPFYCPLTKFGACGQKVRLKGTRPEPFEPPYIFAPQTAGDPVYVVQGRTDSTDRLFLWQPKTSNGTPIDLGFGSAARDASMGREGLSGNPLLPTVHALGTDSDRPQRGWIQKGFPVGGTAADRAAEGVQLDLNHLANSSITTIADEVSGVDQRPAAVFDNNQDIFYAVGRHPRAFNPVGTNFAHWNSAGEWFPTRKLISGRSAQLAKTPAYSVGSTGEFVARMVFADDLGRPAVASFGQNGLLGKPKVLGEYATGAFGNSGEGIQHAIAIGRDSRTYVTWVASNFFGPDSLLLSYSAKGGGTSFSKPVEIATGEQIRNLALAMGQNRGVVAWSDEFGGEASGGVLSVTLATAGAPPPVLARRWHRPSACPTRPSPRSRPTGAWARPGSPPCWPATAA